MATKKTAKKKTAKKIITSTSSLKSVDAAIASVTDMAAATAAAVATVGKENSKLLAQAKRLGKKRASLMKKKKTAANRLKKDPSADNRKAASAIDKELVTVRREATKVAAQKSKVGEELKALKSVSRRAAAYSKAITQADKVLNKPKKKRRVRRKAA